MRLSLKSRKKKEKVIYVDDGRSLVDMSSVSTFGLSGKPGQYRASLKEQWQTYISAVKMMIKPMLFVIGALCTAYGVLYLLLSFA